MEPQHNDQQQQQEQPAPGVPASFLPSVLHQVGITDPETADKQASMDAQVAALRSDDWRERVRAIRVLETWGTRTPVSVLTQALEDSDGAVRAAAVHALGLWGEQAPVERLLPTLRDEDWHVRETAVLALGNLGPRVPEKALVLALNDSDGMVREVARTVLHRRHSVIVSQAAPQEVAPPIEPAPVPERPAVYSIVMEDADPLEAHTDRPDHVSYLDTLRSPERRRKRGLLSHWPLLVACATLLIVGVSVTGWLAFSLTRSSSASSMVVAMPRPTVIPQQQGGTIFQFHNQIAPINSITWSPNSEYVAAANADGMVEVWEPLTGQQLFTWVKPDQSSLTTVAWSPDGRLLAVGGVSDPSVDILDASSGQLLHMLRVNATSSMMPAHIGATHATSGGGNSIESIAWSPDSTRIAAGSGTGIVSIFNVVTGTTIANLPNRSGMEGGTDFVAWSPDGHYLARGQQSEIILYKAGSGQFAYAGNQVTQGLISSLVWSPDSQRLAIGEGPNYSYAAEIWNPFSGQHLYFPGLFVSAWSPDGTRIAAVSLIKGSVQVWDATSGKTLYSYSTGTSQPTCLAWSPDGTFIAAGDYTGVINVWQVTP